MPVELTEDQIHVLPEKRIGSGPNQRTALQCDFMQGPDASFPSRFDYDCMAALISKGIRERQCPIVPEWASFVFAGGFIATLTGKYIQPLLPEPYNWPIRHIVWDVLWEATDRGEQNILNQRFFNAWLRMFLPDFTYSPPDRPYPTNTFERMWIGLYYNSFPCRSAAELLPKKIEYGLSKFDLLPEDIQNSILKVSEHIPAMLEIVIKRIRATFSW